MSLLRWAVVPLLAVAVVAGWRMTDGVARGPAQGQERGEAVAETLRLIAVGDVNLGRRLGQKLLAGDTLHPWVHVRDTLAQYDVVLANLESNISDQGGVTEDPRSNIVFTAPPVAARSLAQGGITVVSTANNHALDFGVGAAEQTTRFLAEAGIAYAGTAMPGNSPYTPVRITKNGVRLALFACTGIMNGRGQSWKQYVAAADTGALLPAIRHIRDSVDFVVVSYHGGEEYTNAPTRATVQFARQVLQGGADLFLGHHPHVPYGIERVNGKAAVHSLGNFVFVQAPYWTRRGFAYAVDIVKDSSGTAARSERVLPLLAGFQPRFVSEGEEAEKILQRIRSLSSEVRVP